MDATAAINHWADPRCARAFWGQHDLPPFRRLVRDTIDWADPRPKDQWLDLGCGGGALTRALWLKAGSLGGVVGLDCAPANAARYADLDAEFGAGGRISFECRDFSAGLAGMADESFDHAVSGLSVTYAENFDGAAGRWTDAGYDRILREVYRVLRPGGRFVFSANVPEPSWLKVGLMSLPTLLAGRRPLRALRRLRRMGQYGRWLKREARGGRFHYLPAAAVEAKLRAAGFGPVEHRLSYAGQAFVFRAVKTGGRVDAR